MKVLQIHTVYREAGGEDVVVETEAAMLRDAGHEVVQRVARNPTGGRASLQAVATAPWRPAAARAVTSTVEAERPDVAAVHNTWFVLSPSIVAALGDAGVPVVMTLHNYRLMCPASTLFHHGKRCTDCVGSHPWHAVAHRCYRDSAALSAVAAATVESWRRSGAIDAVTRFVVMTESAKSLFVAGGLPADRMIVRPHGLADPGVRTGPPPSSSRRLLYVGRAVEEKGLDALLRWWGRRSRPFGLDVIGDGPVREAWADKVPDGVRLLGGLPREEVLGAMREARAVVVPSLWDEPFGLVAVEAMACGTGVLSTGTGGLADIHGHDGGWVAGLSADGGLDDVAWDEVLHTMEEDDVVDRAGHAARERYEDRFTSDRAAASLLDLYESVASTRSYPQ